MEKAFKNLVFLSSLILALTGTVCTLLVLEAFSVPNWVFSQIVRFHVSFSFLFSVLFGLIFEKHIFKMLKLKYKKSGKKILGICVAALFVLLALTSFGMRHIKIKEIKDVIITVHWVVGFVFVIAFLLHFFAKKGRGNV